METENQKILNEAKLRFQQIMEYTTRRNKYTDEADEQPQDPEAPQAEAGGAPMDPNAGGQPDGGGMPMDGGVPMGGGAADPSMGGEQMPQQGDQGADMGDGEGMGGQTPDGFNPQIPQDDAMGGAPMDGGMDGGLQPDDDVIDVSDLTDSQEETQEDIDKLDAKFGKVMKYLGQFEELLRSNDEKINDLKAEFEKRNPTQVEKLSMQTANSYPFNQTPEEYWENKEKTSNYRTENDENGTKQGQYVITKNDLDGSVDWKNIADSLDNFDIMHQTMKNMTGLPI